MRVKFTNHIKSIEDLKNEFCHMLDALPVDLDGYSFSGINFYFNIHDKETGDKVNLMNEDGETITGFTYGRTKHQIKRKQYKSGNIINFNPNKIAEHT